MPLRVLFCFLSLHLLAACSSGPSETRALSPRETSSAKEIERIVLTNSEGQSIQPFSGRPRAATVFVFLSSDCPIANRYAPEVQRLHASYSDKQILFWLVYPNADDTASVIRKHLEEYRYTTGALLDPQHKLVRLGKVSVTPEVAVFDAAHSLVYHGRIDDRYVDFGKVRPAPVKRDLQDVLDAILAGKPLPVTSQRAVGCYIPELQ